MITFYLFSVAFALNSNDCLWTKGSSENSFINCLWLWLWTEIEWEIRKPKLLRKNIYSTAKMNFKGEEFEFECIAVNVISISQWTEHQSVTPNKSEIIENFPIFYSKSKTIFRFSLQFPQNL